MGYEKNLAIGTLNELYGGLLTERQREFIRLYYDCDISLREMSLMFGISPQAVRDAITRGERELRRLENVLRFDDKRRSAVRVAEKINEKSGGAFSGETKKIEELLYD
ncbi:MAG: DNA-binding protein [Clostridiales bacterium]|jgi:predicted DNA-binding protein YlxM (UPF0122 family)|nr:DNA-binding protein [Clostridiales bacterium]